MGSNAPGEQCHIHVSRNDIGGGAQDSEKEWRPVPRGESWAPDHAFNEASAAAAKRVLKGLRGISQRALRARPSEWRVLCASQTHGWARYVCHAV